MQEVGNWQVGLDDTGALVVERDGSPGTVLVVAHDDGVSVYIQDDCDEKTTMAETFATWPELERE
jgi:hypothetical protein